ncbi:MAG: hypothetical protein ACE5EY_10935, partial [Anaerolineae bacterium]
SHAPAIYVAVPKYEPDFAARLAPWNPLTAWTPILDVPPTRLPDMLQSRGDNATSTQFWDDTKVVFDDSVQLGFLGVPTTVSPGDELTIWLAFRAVHPIPKVISAFVHLYGYPLPTEGGHLWTQSDSQICEPYPSTIWQPEETILQEFRLKIPADIPAGQYEIHVGTYESPAGARLPLTGPITNLQNSYPIAKIEVTSP